MSFYDRILEKMKHIDFFKKERGSIFVLTALLLPIMFGCLGIAYDVGTLYMHKSRLQNVADAAALAGGRAYLQSQTKTAEDDRDSVDGTMDYRSKEITNCTYKAGRLMTVKYEYGKKTAIDRGNTTQHPDADTAADNYIYNNIVNLGSTVYADKYSHFALNYGSADSQIFYRIGLYETVPLHFLPVITDKYSETVRAGAIAYVQPGGTDGGGGGVIVNTTKPSLFDNLFTVSQFFDSNRSNENGQAMSASFKGNIVYTYGDGVGTNANANYFYKTRFGDSNSTDHLYETKDTSNYSNNNNVNDPTINTFYNIEAYVGAFEDKLSESNTAHHIGPNLNDWKSLFTVANINNTDSNLYQSEVFVPNWDGGYRVWLGTNKKTPYIYDHEHNKYYAFDSSRDDYI